eukprot:1190955-Prorocentrum_minimum.AAC.3
MGDQRRPWGTTIPLGTEALNWFGGGNDQFDNNVTRRSALLLTAEAHAQQRQQELQGTTSVLELGTDCCTLKLLLPLLRMRHAPLLLVAAPIVSSRFYQTDHYLLQTTSTLLFPRGWWSPTASSGPPCLRTFNSQETLKSVYERAKVSSIYGQQVYPHLMARGADGTPIHDTRIEAMVGVAPEGPLAAMQTNPGRCPKPK